MSREWKPGDVALVTWTDEVDGEIQNQVRIRVKAGETDASPSLRRDAWWGPDGYLTDDCNLSIRPLVVIDPEDREQVERLSRALTAAAGWTEACQEQRTAALNDALRSLIAPPKPEEPTGLGAVVETDGGTRFVRLPDGFWTSEDESQPWRNVNAVRVLSEGVPA